MTILRDYNIITISDNEIEIIKEIIDYGKINKLCEYISYLLKNADNRLYINFKEKDLQIMIYAILTKYTQIDTFLEYKSNDNYIDLYINTKNNNILIELKYIKVKDSNIYNDIYNNALEQIKNII